MGYPHQAPHRAPFCANEKHSKLHVTWGLHSSFDTATTVMSAHNDMFYLQVFDRLVNCRHGPQSKLETLLAMFR